ncbi:hypothetical protein OOZ51_00425 [Arthrobacter sp. MI7-26]|uniref:helicase C-terminal domain-containing protein n=1 Tax=Arthrobacter sp. MI7-26 TaxID=2993653 RepID=UPI0022492B85|nr:helicase C-terminal domain-containing protein [Arthrobacter sp. MI7-26]MCX2746277.1 hypothetical protein [Arthrobacter sp. MI7-26]
MAGIDFSKLTGASASDRELHPRSIFSALPRKSSRFEYLRSVQGEVFEKWFARRNEPDLVVKMNTGNGKTLAGLLLLKSSLNEGVGPAAYLTPDSYLAEQVCTTATDLGLPYSKDPRDPAVASGKAILIATVHTLFNGRSKFGVGSEGRKIKLGTVLIDDAHACLTAVERQFDLRIPQSHAVYDRLLSKFDGPLSKQYPAGLLDLKADERSAALLVPHWDWFDARAEVTEILHSSRNDQALEWQWPLIKDVLPICRCVFTADEVQIRPPAPPVTQIQSFTDAKRHIYLTATLADDSVLVSHFNASPDSVSHSISPSAADDTGDRMILIPQEVHPDWTDEDLKAYLEDQGKVVNVVVIVPSRVRATWWSDVATETLTAENIEQGVRDLSEGVRGITVLVGKYDGIDLPDAACRILVIDGLPEAYSGVDRIESAALEDTMSMMGRQLQRIEQGMGRGVRSRDDYCVVILLGSKLVRRLHDPSARQHFSPATRAQLDLSSEIAEQLAGGTIDDFKAVIDQCLNRDIGWITASRNALAGIEYESGHVSAIARPIRRAFDLAAQSRYQEATDAIQGAVNASGDDHAMRGWIKQMQVMYLHPVDPVRAQKCQTSALDDNRSLLKPEQGIAYVRLNGPAAHQAKATADFLSENYGNPADLLIGFNAILADLVYDPDPALAEPFEQAIADLGRHLGFTSQRPEKDFKKGPDGLWHFGEAGHAVIEVKNNAVTDFIKKHDLGQLSVSMNWFNSEYAQPAVAVPVMFHRSHKPNHDAFPPPGARVVTSAGLEKLRESVKAFATAISVDSQFLDPDAVGRQLLQNRLNGKNALLAFATTTVAKFDG